MKYYIDTENVGPAGLMGIGKLSPSDEVILFARGPLSKKITQAATNTHARITIQPVTGDTKNAMDFVIVALVGMNAQPGVIVSKDQGYTPAVMLMQSKGITVMEAKSIDDALLFQNAGKINNTDTGHNIEQPPKKKEKIRNIRSEIGVVLAEEMPDKKKRHKAIERALKGNVKSLSISKEGKARIRQILA